MNFYIRKKRPLVINVVSLIDILILLLIFFIVTTTFKKADTQLQINLPQSATGKKGEGNDTLVLVYATKDQKVLVGDQATKLEMLVEVLKNKKVSSPQASFALKADKDVPLGFFVKVLDASTQAGIPNISLFTEETTSNQ